MADSRFIFESLGMSIGQEIGCYLEDNNLKHAILVSKPMLQMFKKPLKAAKLLRLVEEANYKEAQQEIVDDPTCIFQHVSFKKRDAISGKIESKKTEIISPLKLAFKLYDTRMWKIFLERIENNPEMMKRFYQQAEEQTKHIGIKRLKKAYKDYRKKQALWANNYLTDVKVNLAWLTLGKKQRKHMPKWMVKELCYKENAWNKKFNLKTLPDNNEALFKTKYNINDKVISLHLEPNKGWGFNFTLVRGDESCAWALPASVDLCHLRYRFLADLKIISPLFRERKTEFTKLLAEKRKMDMDAPTKFKI